MTCFGSITCTCAPAARVWALAQARQQGKDILVTTLVESDSNRFYLRHGFEKEGADGVDVHYRWRVSAEGVC